MASAKTRADEDEPDDDPGEHLESVDDLEYEPEDDEIVTLPCPSCRRPIWEEAEACEHCGHYVSASARLASKPRWIVLGFLLSLIAILAWLLWR